MTYNGRKCHCQLVSLFSVHRFGYWAKIRSFIGLCISNARSLFQETPAVLCSLFLHIVCSVKKLTFTSKVSEYLSVYVDSRTFSGPCIKLIYLLSSPTERNVNMGQYGLLWRVFLYLVLVTACNLKLQNRKRLHVQIFFGCLPSKNLL